MKLKVVWFSLLLSISIGAKAANPDCVVSLRGKTTLLNIKSEVIEKTLYKQVRELIGKNDLMSLRALLESGELSPNGYNQQFHWAKNPIFWEAIQNKEALSLFAEFGADPLILARQYEGGAFRNAFDQAGFSRPGRQNMEEVFMKAYPRKEVTADLIDQNTYMLARRFIQENNIAKLKEMLESETITYKSYCHEINWGQDPIFWEALGNLEALQVFADFGADPRYSVPVYEQGYTSAFDRAGSVRGGFENVKSVFLK
jgi:hypothetical protein